MTQAAMPAAPAALRKERTPGSVIYIIHRVAILLACAAVFYPGFNPGRITTAINRNVSLFTASISYSTLVGGQLERPLARGWVQSSTFVLVMIASIILVVGIALCAVGGCMSVGNNRMQRRGLLFPLAGSLVMTGGLGGIYVAYSQIVAAANSRVPANFAPGFVLYTVLAAVTLATTLVLLAMDRRRAETLEPKMEMHERYKIFLFFLPILALAFVFSYLPLWGWRYAFFDYKAGGELTMENFVGFKWFTYLFESEATRSDIFRVIKNTLGLSGIGIFTSWLPMAFAIFLTQVPSKRFRRFVQTFTTVPNFLGWVIIYAVALAISSITGIDPVLYEAAEVDGAGRFQKMWNVTVPQLLPTFFVMLLMSIANILSNGMEQYLVFSNAVNSQSIEVLDLYVYNLGIVNGQIPISTMVGMCKSIISVALLFIANTASKKLRGVQDFGNSVLITVSRTILATALMMLCSAFAGYLTTKQKMWKRSFWYRALVITMYFNAGTIPWYLNMLGLGLTDNYLGYIIPAIVAPYNIILVKTYIESIPASLEESATIDGAGVLQVFTKIILSLSKPILATIAIFGAVGNWNALQDSLILMSNSPGLYTMQHRLWIYLNSSSNLAASMQSGGAVSAAMLNNKVIKYTISMVTVIPIMLVYPFMQRYFEEGIMLGAVKG